MFITGDRTGARAALNMGLNAVMKIKDREARDNATGCVIYGFSEIGDFERAFVLGRTKLEGDWTEAVYSGIASIAASSGDQKTFQLALSKIKNKKAHDSTLWSAALVQAEHHQFTEAGRTASLIGNISNKDGAFEFIAGMQAKTGDIISAQENLAKVDSVYFRVDARRAICNSLVNKGDVEGAVTYALQAKEPYEQVCGLAGVAEGMIESRKKPVKSLAKR
jgi:hypothetical protein